MNKELKIAFTAPLQKGDTESQTYGCRANTPDICGSNGIPNIFAFASIDCICKTPSKALKNNIISVAR